MRFRSRAALLFCLIAALGVRSAWAAPGQLEDELRAVTLCAAHGGMPVSVPAARQCCSIDERADDPASFKAAPEAPARAVAELPVDAALERSIARDRVVAAAPEPPRGPPRRVLLCSLQR